MTVCRVSATGHFFSDLVRIAEADVAGGWLGLAEIGSCMMGCWASDTTPSPRVRKEKRA